VKRSLPFLAVAAALVLSTPAAAGRPPTAAESIQLRQAVLSYFEGVLSTTPPPGNRVTRVQLVRVSTIHTGGYTRFATAIATPKNGEHALTLLGLRGALWHVIAYGTSGVGCSNHLGPRKAALLRDLTLTCP
jgi:hypothetical protein